MGQRLFGINNKTSTETFVRSSYFIPFVSPAVIATKVAKTPVRFN
jgi:ABC-type sugar transport system permease subunit